MTTDTLDQLTLDQLRQLRGGEHLHARFRTKWGWSAEEPVVAIWRGGILWAVHRDTGRWLEPLCWSAGAKPTERLEHKVRAA